MSPYQRCSIKRWHYTVPVSLAGHCKRNTGYSAKLSESVLSMKAKKRAAHLKVQVFSWLTEQAKAI